MDTKYRCADTLAYSLDNNNRIAMIDIPLNVWYTRTYILCELK